MQQLDFAFILTGQPEYYAKEMEVIRLSTENLVLGLHVSHPAARGIDLNRAPYSIIHLSLLKEDDFALAPNHSTMRSELLDPLFEAEGFTPHITIESGLNEFLEQMTALGMCNCIIPQYQISDRENIAWFYLPSLPHFHFALACQKFMNHNKAIQYFISIAKQTAEKTMNFPEPRL